MLHLSKYAPGQVNTYRDHTAQNGIKLRARGDRPAVCGMLPLRHLLHSLTPPL